MEKTLEIKSPWTMVPMEYIDLCIAEIRNALPPDHPLQEHALYPGIKWERRPIFIVDDDTTGGWIRMDFEHKKRWRKTKFKVPAMQVFKGSGEVAAMIDSDHLAELAAWRAAAAEE